MHAHSVPSRVLGAGDAERNKKDVCTNGACVAAGVDIGNSRHNKLRTFTVYSRVVCSMGTSGAEPGSGGLGWAAVLRWLQGRLC